MISYPISYVGTEVTVTDTVRFTADVRLLSVTTPYRYRNRDFSFLRYGHLRGQLLLRSPLVVEAAIWFMRSWLRLHIRERACAQGSRRISTPVGVAVCDYTIEISRGSVCNGWCRWLNEVESRMEVEVERTIWSRRQGCTSCA